MTSELTGLTAYSKDEKDCFCLVDVRSNVDDLSVYSDVSNKQT